MYFLQKIKNGIFETFVVDLKWHPINICLQLISVADVIKLFLEEIWKF